MTQTTETNTQQAFAELRIQVENSANPPKGWSRMTPSQLRAAVAKENSNG